jgi:tetrapyrrole methylase family protein/MazG family protein
MDQSNNKSDLLQSFKSLVEVVEQLRGPEGCPWDKEQSQKSLTPYILEEAFELVEAIESSRQDLIQEELGDYLFQVVLQAQVASDEKYFDLRQVIEGLVKKMIYRHPHVFQKTEEKSIEQVWQNWEKLKQKEKANSPQPLFNYPKNLPALLAAQKIGGKTARLRFDWPHPDQVLAKVKEEIGELEEEMKKPKIESERLEHELGDLLFSVAQLSRHLNIDPEASLRSANRRFAQRLNEVIKKSGLPMEDFQNLSEEVKEKLWQEVKKDESSGKLCR